MAIQPLHISSQRKSIDVQANQAIFTELIKNVELSKFTLINETPLIQVIDRPFPPLEKETFGKMKGIISGSLITSLVVLILSILKEVFKTILAN